MYGSTCPNGHAVEKGSSFCHHQLKADKASIIKANGIIKAEALLVTGDKATIASQKHSNLHLGYGDRLEVRPRRLMTAVVVLAQPIGYPIDVHVMKKAQ